MIPLSKTMRMSDMEELKPELETVDKVLAVLKGGDKAQGPLRRWEYAMALKAYNEWRGEGSVHHGNLLIADHGCATGMLSPMLYWMGNEVWMYEVWAWGNQEDFANWQMERMREFGATGSYRWIHRGLGQLTEEDNGVDCAFCISTMEHIFGHTPAFRQMCQTVKPGGMLFLTTDFADRPGFGFFADSVRPDGMFCADTYRRMVEISRDYGFSLMGGLADWNWDESCRLVHDYGFASLALKRDG